MLTNPIQVLSETELLGHKFTVYGTAENPLFLAKEVAECIDYAKTSKGKFDVSNMVSSVDEEEKLVRTIFVSGQNREVWLLTEDGLYEVLMQSRKPIAKEFKKGVKEILKAIRKTGGYIATKSDDTPEEIMARALTIAQATLAKREERLKQLEAQAEQQKATIEIQTEEIKKAAPKVLFADAVIGSRSSCLIGELAKIISQNGFHVGQNRLFEWLRNNHYLGSVGERRNIPNQQYVEQGLFELKKGTRSGNDGVLRTTITTKVTGKGQAYFINGFLTGKFII